MTHLSVPLYFLQTKLEDCTIISQGKRLDPLQLLVKQIIFKSRFKMFRMGFMCKGLVKLHDVETYILK